MNRVSFSNSIALRMWGKETALVVSEECGLGSPARPWAKSDWQFQRALGLNQEGQNVPWEFLPVAGAVCQVQSECSDLSSGAAGHPLLWGSSSFWAAVPGRFWEMSAGFIPQKSHMPWGRRPSEKQNLWEALGTRGREYEGGKENEGKGRRLGCEQKEAKE